MIIRKTQIEVLEKTAVNNFAAAMAQHCEKFSPHLTKTLNRKQLKEAVHFNIKKAETYGFDQRGPVRFFIDLAIVLGSGFDTDPQYPWITEVLNQEKETDSGSENTDEPEVAYPQIPGAEKPSENQKSQLQRAEDIFTKTSEYLKNVDGENNKYTLEALQILSNQLEKDALNFQREGFDAGILKLMKEIHPRKYKETGEEALRELIRQNRKKALEIYKFRSPRAVALIVVLAFAFGHEFDIDPFLPWIAKTLNKENMPPEEKAEELEKRAVIWLKAVLKNTEEVK